MHPSRDPPMETHHQSDRNDKPIAKELFHYAEDDEDRKAEGE